MTTIVNPGQPVGLTSVNKLRLDNILRDLRNTLPTLTKEAIVRGVRGGASRIKPPLNIRQVDKYLRDSGLL